LSATSDILFTSLFVVIKVFKLRKLLFQTAYNLLHIS
jgi:hypothetical protein